MLDIPTEVGDPDQLGQIACYSLFFGQCTLEAGCFLLATHALEQ